ncbi:MAG: hypothetical protein ABI868_15340 [Acidobacteriota bacterium]
MSFQVDIWLRGTDVATTATLQGITREPGLWVDDDVRLVLEAMLRAMHQLKHPADAHVPITLRGLSWIVNPFDGGGVVIAIEITLGAAIAGPFDIDKGTLEMTIERVLRHQPVAGGTIH